MKKIITILIIVIGVIAVLLFAFNLFYPDKEMNNTPIELENNDNNNTKTESSNNTVDLSGTYTKNEKETFRKECEKILNEFYPLYFNYDTEPTEDNKKVFSYLNEDSEIAKTANDKFWKYIENFKSKYKSHRIGYFEIQKASVPYIQVAAVVNADMSGKRLDEGNYDILSLVSFIKTDNGWKIDDFSLSAVLKGNTAHFSDNETDGFVDFSGDYVTTFKRSENRTKQEYDENRKVYGDIIEDEDNISKSDYLNNYLNIKVNEDTVSSNENTEEKKNETEISEEKEDSKQDNNQENTETTENIELVDNNEQEEN